MFFFSFCREIEYSEQVYFMVKYCWEGLLKIIKFRSGKVEQRLAVHSRVRIGIKIVPRMD